MSKVLKGLKADIATTAKLPASEFWLRVFLLNVWLVRNPPLSNHAIWNQSC